jgi:hypothetical protein
MARCSFDHRATPERRLGAPFAAGSGIAAECLLLTVMIVPSFAANGVLVDRRGAVKYAKSRRAAPAAGRSVPV